MIKTISILALVLVGGSAVAQTLPPPAQGIVNTVFGGGSSTPPPSTPASVKPGSSPDGNRETGPNGRESALCATLAKDNRGQVSPHMKAKYHCN